MQIASNYCSYYRQQAFIMTTVIWRNNKPETISICTMCCLQNSSPCGSHCYALVQTRSGIPFRVSAWARFWFIIAVYGIFSLLFCSAFWFSISSVRYFASFAISVDRPIYHRMRVVSGSSGQIHLFASEFQSFPIRLNIVFVSIAAKIAWLTPLGRFIIERY